MRTLGTRRAGRLPAASERFVYRDQIDDERLVALHQCVLGHILRALRIIDVNYCWLARPPVRGLGLLEVGRAPEVIGDKRQEFLAHLHVLPRLDVLRPHPATPRGADLGIRQLELGLLDGGLGGDGAGRGSLDLRAGEIDLRFGRSLLELGHGELELGSGTLGGSVPSVGLHSDDLGFRQCLRRLCDEELPARLVQLAARLGCRSAGLHQLHQQVSGVEPD